MPQRRLGAGQHKRGQRPAAAQPRAVTGAARGRPGLEGVQRDGCGRAAQSACPAAVDQQVSVLLNGAVVWCLDQQVLRRFGAGDEILLILQKTRTIAVQLESVDVGGDQRREGVGSRWRTPPV